MKHPIYFMKFVMSILSILAIASLLFAESKTLTAPDGTTVTINRDSYGVPHIVGESEVGVFFGQGFAIAEDRLNQLDLHRRAAEGRLSESFGIFTVSNDQARRAEDYTKAERQQQFAALPENAREMLTAYTAGVNTYIDSMNANPQKYKPIEFSNTEMERWTVYNSVAVIQFLIRIFGQAGGEELDRLAELQSNGQQWLDEHKPINDPNVPTTITGGGSTQSQQWHYSGIHVSPDFINSYKDKKQQLRNNANQVGLPSKFGSFAVLISTGKSTTGNVMLLGAPQMGPPEEFEPSITNEVELSCPSFHVGGMTVTGIPLVIIGHTETHAWTLTSGASDNSDVYIETTVDNTFSKYQHNGVSRDFEVIQDTIQVAGLPNGIPFKHYRTVHGPVFADDLTNNQAFSMKMTFWNQELELITFALAIVKAKNLEEFEAAAALNPMSFNLFYAGKDQKIKYWHIGKYQDRSDGVDPRLPHNGDGSEEWGGLIPFDQLPNADFSEQTYFVNWNNKPVSWWNNGDNISWTLTSGFGTRVNAIETFVGPISSFTYAHLKDVPRQINDHGTYQQAIELSPTQIFDENLIPPGQSGFIDLNGQPSPHFSDQWPLHVNWEFKDMEFSETPVSVESYEPVPKQFALQQNYPNPFNPQTTIQYQLLKAGEVSVSVYNLLGQEVRALVNKHQAAGSYSVVWDGKNDMGQVVSSGMYFYKLKIGEVFIATRKMLFLK